jgi:glycosyltransferase involved in cell wall biosynthesis
MARNQWFRQQAVRSLERLNSDSGAALTSGKATLFAYSYAALEILRFAKARGWRTILGQIDAGPAMERAYGAQEAKYPVSSVGRLPPPPEYWETWREECAIADLIVVNSGWSRLALLEEGLPAEKLRVIPLAFERQVSDPRTFQREYPERFTNLRPLRVLFLGQVNLLKGIMPLLEAAKALATEPVEFLIVGPMQLKIPDEFRINPRIRWVGPVARGIASNYYRDADVFVFPTLSDGFGLTQLEAQAHQLPVIASRFCGDVVEDGRNGLLLDEVSSGTIVAALLSLLRNPESLRQMADHSAVDRKFSLAALGERFKEMSLE